MGIGTGLLTEYNIPAEGQVQVIVRSGQPMAGVVVVVEVVEDVEDAGRQSSQ